MWLQWLLIERVAGKVNNSILRRRLQVEVVCELHIEFGIQHTRARVGASGRKLRAVNTNVDGMNFWAVRLPSHRTNIIIPRHERACGPGSAYMLSLRRRAVVTVLPSQ